MDKFLWPHNDYAAAYLDNIMISDQDWEMDIQKVTTVLCSLRAAGLIANSTKCTAGKRETWYLGYLLGGQDDQAFS